MQLYNSQGLTDHLVAACLASVSMHSSEEISILAVHLYSLQLQQKLGDWHAI